MKESHRKHVTEDQITIAEKKQIVKGKGTVTLTT